MTTESLGSPPKIDIHVHLAGTGTQGSGCWISPAFRRSPIFIALRLLHRIGARELQTTIDQDWAARISGLVAESELDLAVVLGFDGVYDSRGELDREKSQMIVPADWVFDVCRRYSNLVPGPSINPYRRDGLERLEEVIEAGVSLIKWLPIVQAFDPASSRSQPFIRRLSDAGIPLLVHAGTGELTFRTVDHSVGDLARLIPALEMGVKVICAHTAAPIHHSREPSQLPLLRSLLERFPNLWVDNSGLANPSRFLHLPRFAADPLIRDRTLHGSDFPIPCHTVLYSTRLGARRVVEIGSERNPFQKEVLLKRSLGFPDSTLSRAAAVLANLSLWHRPTFGTSTGYRAD